MGLEEREIEVYNPEYFEYIGAPGGREEGNKYIISYDPVFVSSRSSSTLNFEDYLRVRAKEMHHKLIQNTEYIGAPGGTEDNGVKIPPFEDYNGELRVKSEF